MERKITRGLLHNTNELKKLISEYPDYPIAVLCSEDVNIGNYSWCFAMNVRCDVGEILDCVVPCNDEKSYTDRDDFEEDMLNYYADDEEYTDLTDSEYENEIKEKISEYDAYWQNCIFIYADV